MQDWALWAALASPILTAAGLVAGLVYGYGRFTERVSQLEARLIDRLDRMDQRIDRLEAPYFTGQTPGFVEPPKGGRPFGGSG